MPGGGTNPVPMEQWLHCTTHNLESEGGSRPNHRPNSPQMVVWMEDQMGAFRGMKLSPHLWFLFIMFWIVLAYIYIYRRFIWTVHLNHFESTWYQHLHKWYVSLVFHSLLEQQLPSCLGKNCCSALGVGTFRFYTITTGMSVALSTWIIAGL